MKMPGPGKLLATLLILLSLGAQAHPLGNNTVNRQTRLTISEHQVTVNYRLELAELRTLAAMEDADEDRDGQTTEAEWATWRSRLGVELTRQLELRLDGERLRLRVARISSRLSPGEAGLPVLQTEVRLTANLRRETRPELSAENRPMHFADRFREGDNGWREIYVEATGNARLGGNVATRDRSAGLSRFPEGEPLLVETQADFTLTQPAVVVAARPGTVAATHEQPTIQSTPAAPGASDESGQAAVVPETMMTTVVNFSIPPASVSATPAHIGRLDFFRLGMHHFATGWDHLVFLLGLLLLSRRLGDVLRLVSTFTIAHSLTFLCAAAGWIMVPGALVEALIALTIAYVGELALSRRSGGHGLALAFVFGLVHGFGFAGALAESLGAAEPDAGWLWHLVAFNLGIEAVQIVLVISALALFHVLRFAPWRKTAHAFASASVLVSGLAWFFTRLSL